MRAIGIRQARAELGDLVINAHTRGEATLITRYGAPWAAIVPATAVLTSLTADGYDDCDDAGPLPRVEIVPVTEPDELYHQVPGEGGPQPVYVELDLETRTLSATYDPEVGTTPMRPREVVHGLVRRYPIPPLTADAANRIMAQIRPYAARICADWFQHWDGDDHIAALGDDARAAEAALLAHLGDQDDWDPADLVGGIPADLSEISDMVSADTTDSELDDLVAQIMADLAKVEPSGVVTSEAEDVIRDYLSQARDEARDDA